MTLPKGTDSKKWLTARAYDIGRQVSAGKNVMIFYPFIKENANWPSTNHVMAAISAIGDIDEERDTVMHNNIMDGKDKKRVLPNIWIEWQKRVVMTNTSVTAGLNFDVTGWSHMSYDCVSNFQSPREIIQWLSRARHIIDY